MKKRSMKEQAVPSLEHLGPVQDAFRGNTDSTRWPDGVCCVEEAEHAKWVVKRLKLDSERIWHVHAVDTEVWNRTLWDFDIYMFR